MATHSSILAWRIPWTEEPGRVLPMGSQTVGHNWETSHSFICYPDMKARPGYYKKRYSQTNKSYKDMMQKSLAKHRDTSFHCTLPYCTSLMICFYKLKVCGNPAWSNAMGINFPTAFSHFVFLCQFSSVQSFSRVRLFATPWIAARQASLSITNSWSLLKFMSIESCHTVVILTIFQSLSFFIKHFIYYICSFITFVLCIFIKYVHWYLSWYLWSVISTTTKRLQFTEGSDHG